MKRFVVTVAIAGVMFQVSPAMAKTPACVDRAEYRRVRIHQTTKSQVKAVFDTSGHESMSWTIGNDHYETRNYTSCYSSYGVVSVSFTNRVADEKFAIW